MDNSPENKITQQPEENNTAVTEKEFEFLGDPTAKAAPKKQSPLLKKLRPLIALCVVAVVLFAGVIVLKEVVPEEVQDITEEETDDSIELIDINGTSAQTLHIKNTVDEYTFVRRLEKTYYIEGHDDLPVSKSKIISALTYAGSVSAETEVAKNVTDWEEYGLKDPIATVTWTKDDTTHYFELGDLAPSGNYYMRFNGGDTVYTYDVTAADMFITSRMDYYDISVFQYNSETDAPYIMQFSIYQKGGETVVADLQDLASDDLGTSAYIMSEPIVHNFSTEKFDAISTLMGNLTSLTVFSDDISDENLEKYGLLDPKYTFTFTNVAVKNVAHFGNTADEGYVYMYAEGNDFIYIIDKEIINCLTYDVAAYCDEMSYSRSYDTIDTLTISGGGKTYNIDITGTSEESNLKAYINNKYVEYENFASLYAHIISVSISEVGQKPSGVDPIVTITVRCIDGTTDVLKYYKISDLNCFFELNGEGRLIVSTSKVEQILTFAQQLYDGQEIILDW